MSCFSVPSGIKAIDRSNFLCILTEISKYQIFYPSNNETFVEVGMLVINTSEKIGLIKSIKDKRMYIITDSNALDCETTNCLSFDSSRSLRGEKHIQVDISVTHTLRLSLNLVRSRHMHSFRLKES